MFLEHVERRFLDPKYSLDEYFQLGSRRKVGPIKNQLALLPTRFTKKHSSNKERAEGKQEKQHQLCLNVNFVLVPKGNNVCQLCIGP